mmetsp:Transcript_11314/g.42251  ORF Transcript_11314/g.42251 Transcript_11314/m.42251 type:complete len:410 (+) Transcript_11314:433-1662(+)|eukprot:scaffold52_cov246-Pinguiococcus_pyrenoidosus.AAC.8
MGTGDHRGPVPADRQAPDLCGVAPERQDFFVGVRVPVLEGLVLRYGEEEVRLVDELDGHDAVVVRQDALVAVPKVQAPDLDCLVSASGHQECALVRDRHAERRELVPIQAEEELERVVVENLDGAVQEADGDQQLRPVLRVAELDAQRVLGQGQRARMHEAQDAPVAQLKVPELDGLVGTCAGEARAVRSKRHVPHGSLVSLDGLRHVPTGDFEDADEPLSRADDHVSVPGRECAAQRESPDRRAADAVAGFSVPDLHAVGGHGSHQRRILADGDRANVAPMAMHVDDHRPHGHRNRLITLALSDRLHGDQRRGRFGLSSKHVPHGQLVHFQRVVVQSQKDARVALPVAACLRKREAPDLVWRAQQRVELDLVSRDEIRLVQWMLLVFRTVAGTPILHRARGDCGLPRS